jgi:hypothetical protein
VTLPLNLPGFHLCFLHFRCVHRLCLWVVVA